MHLYLLKGSKMPRSVDSYKAYSLLSVGLLVSTTHINAYVERQGVL